MIVAAVTVLATSAGRLVQAAPVGRLPTQVSSSPDFSGPGAELIQRVLNWTTSYGLWACLGAAIVGAALYAFGQASGSYGGGSGKKMIIGGGAGAAIIGLAPTAINELFNAAG